MKKLTEFMKLAKQSASYYNQITIDSTKKTNNKQLVSLQMNRTNKYKGLCSLSSFHKEHLHDKFLQTEYSSITNSTLNNNSVKKLPQFFITKTNIDTNSTPLIKREGKSQEQTSDYKPSFYPICTDEYRLYSNSRLREETVNQFIDKTMVIAKGKYFYTIQQELQKELNESNEIKIQGEEEKLKGLIFNKKLLDIYSQNFLLYLKFLNLVIEKEKTVFIALDAQREILSFQIKNMKEKINSYRKELVVFKEYKQFILLVKYHVTKISQLPLDVFKKHFGNDNCVRKPSTQKVTKGKRNRFSIRKTDPLIISNVDDLKANTQPAPDFQTVSSESIETEIFSTPKEFNNEYKEVEEKVLKMFISLTDENRELILLRQNRDDLVNYKETQERIANEMIEAKEKKIQLIKRKNIMLVNEYDSVKQVIINDSIQQKIKQKLKFMLLNIPINIEKDLDLPFAYDHIKTKGNILLVFGNKINPTIYYLEVLEQILLTLIEKVVVLKKNPKMAFDYVRIKNGLDIKKRIQNNRLKIKAEKERRELMNVKILEKTSKLKYLPYRKTNSSLINIRHTQNMKENKKKMNKKENNELTIYDVIHYD